MTVTVTYGRREVTVEAWVLRDPVPSSSGRAYTRFESPAACAAAWLDPENDYSRLTRLVPIVNGRAMPVCPWPMVAPVYRAMDELRALRESS
jgi:hypothetical protein